MNHLMIKELATGIVEFDSSMKKGVAHTALDDAVSQAKWVSVCWQGLRAKGGIKIFFYYHPESDSAFTSMRDDLHGTGDGMVEEIDERKFWDIIARQKDEKAPPPPPPAMMVGLPPPPRVTLEEPPPPPPL